MEVNKQYKVVFDDGERPRPKELIYKNTIGHLLIFLNPKTNREENINELKIIRIEEMDNGKNNL